MVSQPQSPAQVIFGPFTVNGSSLYKSGVRLRLSGQPFQILLILLARPGEVVTSEQLREQIWNQGTFVDFEHGLHAAINKLRKGLGDSAENPRYIETVPGQGYRFIGTLQGSPAPTTSAPGVTDSSERPAQASEKSRPSGRSWSRRRWLGAATLILLSGVCV